MSVAAGPQLVMLSAASPGAGKSSVMAELARRVELPVVVITEDDVWGRRELEDHPVDVLTAREDFRQIVAREPDNDFVELLTRLFDRLVAECVAAKALWVQDWTWPDLVRMSWRRVPSRRRGVSRLICGRWPSQFAR